MKRNLITTSIIFLIVFFNCACKFPDNIPEWQGVNSYQLSKIQFGKTTLNEFQKLSDGKPNEQVGNIKIFNITPAEKDLFKKIRVGFKKEKLDWIEFSLNKDIEISKFLEVYGKPADINTKYSKILDYYDYGFFNVSADKNIKLAKHITIFEIPKPVLKIEKVDISNKVGSWKNLSKVGFLNLKPGLTIESDFNRDFPQIYPYKRDKFDTTSVYTLDYQLGKSKTIYNKAILTFNNGLLSWISLYPHNLSLNAALKAYGTTYKHESLNSKYDLYDFSNFVLVVDKAQKKVRNIGLLATK